MSEDVIKKQHYVPQMYLRNFCIQGEKDKCYEYNSYTQQVRKKSIKDLCEMNYLYEIRNDAGEFIIPQSKNKIEKALNVIETQDAAFLRELISKNEHTNDSIFLSEEERQSLLGFIFLMLLRNPALKEVLPEAFNKYIGIEIKNKAELSVAWIATLIAIETHDNGLNNSVITFLKTEKNSSLHRICQCILLGIHYKEIFICHYPLMWH